MASTSTDSPVKRAMRERRSSSKVTDVAPSHAELLELIEAAGQVADHGGQHPWRFIEIRGDDRDIVGHALAKASGAKGKDAEKYVGKAKRAPLLLAVVVTHPNGKYPDWEHESTASGVAHSLELLLHEAGYGAMWRTGDNTRAKAVHKAHKLSKNEELLGWIYVGGLPDRRRGSTRSRINPSHHLSSL